MRAVVDPNVVISAALSPGGSPASVVLAWLDGRFELVASSKLVAELDRALAYPKIRRRIPDEDATALVRLIERGSVMKDDIDDPPAVSRDPGDDYLIALARESEAVIVTGDQDLLAIGPELPVFSPAEFLDWLEGHERS